jgi:hypothetical protein
MQRFWLDSGVTHVAEGMQWGNNTLTIRLLGNLPPVAQIGYLTFATDAELTNNYPMLVKTLID